jgi:hypothetical protein
MVQSKPGQKKARSYLKYPNIKLEKQKKKKKKKHTHKQKGASGVAQALA